MWSERMAETSDKPTTQAPAPKWGIEAISRTTATALALTYGVGFIIVSAYEAQFGFTEFNPIRAKIFFTGFMFACLSALPAAAFHFGFTQFIPIPTSAGSQNPRVEATREWARLSTFIFTAIVMAFFSRFLLISPAATGGPLPEWVDYYEAAALLLYMASFPAIYRYIDKKPGACVLLIISSWVLLLIVIAIDSSEASWQTYRLALWYFAAGAVISIASQASDPTRKALHWGNWLVAVLLISYYTFSIYSKIEQKFGGGAPMPAVLYLDKPAGWTDSTIVNVKLLDQTSEGYYVILPSMGGDKAMFIRRSEVSAVYFGQRSLTPARKP
jgi:hypothetical protein